MVPSMLNVYLHYNIKKLNVQADRLRRVDTNIGEAIVGTI
jgi:hypothetical protein